MSENEDGKNTMKVDMPIIVTIQLFKMKNPILFDIQYVYTINPANICGQIAW